MSEKLEIDVDPIEPTITTRRAVNAPRALVWDCFTKPEHVGKWKAPPGVEMVVCDVDLRAGGAWRVVYRRPNGDEFGFHGEYREVVVPERYVRTFVMNGGADEVLETLVLTEVAPKRTLITTTNAYATKAIRDALTGAASGMGPAYDKLDALVASLE
jgi:uncharacterized protein YndB with AHSA1/START domain